MRQRRFSLTAGDWHGVPLRVRAPHRRAWRKGKGSWLARCMGLSRVFIESPGLPLVYVAHNGLAAGVDMNVFNPNCLLTTASKLG